MRNQLLAAAAVLSLAAAPAFAQTTTPPANSPTQPIGANAGGSSAPAATMQPATTAAGGSMSSGPMMPGHEPMSQQASNISPADTHSDVAPRLPAPPVGPDANAQQLLQAAQMALSHKRSGEAQEALERAETRLLDRSTMPDAAGMPDSKPVIGLISQARDALGRRDWSQANDAISQAMKAPAVMNDADANGPT